MNTQVIEFLTNTPNSNKAAISEATGIKGLPLFNLLKQMVKDGQIISIGDGSDTTYAIAPSQTEEVAVDAEPIIEQPMTETVAEETVIADEQANGQEQPISAGEEKSDDEAKSDEQQESTPAKVSSGRDNTKYSLNGEGSYGKGPLVVKILEAYLRKNPSTTYKQLKEVFPDTLMKRFGVFEEITKAKEISGKRDRYFMKPEHILKTGDKKQIVACSQWTSSLILPLIECSRKLGMKIKPA